MCLGGVGGWGESLSRSLSLSLSLSLTSILDICTMTYKSNQIDTCALTYKSKVLSPTWYVHSLICQLDLYVIVQISICVLWHTNQIDINQIVYSDKQIKGSFKLPWAWWSAPCGNAFDTCLWEHHLSTHVFDAFQMCVWTGTYRSRLTRPQLTLK